MKQWGAVFKTALLSEGVNCDELKSKKRNERKLEVLVELLCCCGVPL
jgi:hypothetical protein